MTTWTPQAPQSEGWDDNSLWLLAAGYWDDLGQWDDLASWRDGALWQGQTNQAETWT